MEELLKKAHIQDDQIKRLVTKLVSTNLGGLSEPCFVPSVKKDYYDFLHYSGLHDSDLKEFRKKIWAGRKEEKFAHLFKDNPTTFYLFLLSYFLKKRDITTATYLFVYFSIRQYSQQMDRYFSKYCDSDVFRYAITSLTKTHLFSREKTIPNAIYYLSIELMKRYNDKIKDFDMDGLSSYYMETRHRISQSLKSFASVYYKSTEEGNSISAHETIGDDDENQYQIKDQEKANRVIEKVTHLITVYRQIDEEVKDEARKISKINIGLATGLVSSLSNPKFSDNIRLILKLFFKDISNLKTICGKEYYDFIRQLMSIKRTTAKIYFKQQILILLNDVTKDLGYKKQYSKLTSQTQFLINLFIAYYITLVVRKSIC
jgi:hypothetical protein